MNYYPRHIGDYIGATAHLSMVEDGAYNRLLDWYYLDESPIPNDKRAIYRRCRASSDEERNAIDVVLDEFFSFAPDANAFLHGRADEEISKYRDKSNKAAKSARVRWNANAHQNDANAAKPDANACETHGTSQCVGNANQEPRTKNQRKLESANADLLPESPATHDGKNGKVPNCPVQQIVAAYHAALPELSPVRALPEQTVKMIRTRWREDPERQTLDWWTSFFGYVRECPFLVGQVNGFQADLLWIVRPTNFAKILNGNYERGTDNARGH